MLTDLHQSNIFVDKDWRITCLLGLQWACSRPVEMLQTPTWLTNKAVDEIAEDAQGYDLMRREFVDVLAAEEQRTGSNSLPGAQQPLPVIMKDGWKKGTFWYSLALASPTGLFAVFYKQIQPRISKTPEHLRANYALVLGTGLGQHCS